MDIWKLFRISQPIGFFWLLLPGLWGWALSLIFPNTMARMPEDFLWFPFLPFLPSLKPLSTYWVQIWNQHSSLCSCIMLILGSFWARSLGCCWNDFIDQDIDGNVPRTCQRPFVLKTVRQGDRWILMIWSIVGSFFFGLTLPKFAIFIGIFGFLGSLVYPYIKKTQCFPPQIALGGLFNLNIYMGYLLHQGYWSFKSLWILSLLLSYGILLTLHYDTLYSYQDYKADRMLGLYSMAVVLGNTGWNFLKNLLFLRSCLVIFILISLCFEGNGPLWKYWGAGTLYTLWCNLAWQGKGLDPRGLLSPLQGQQGFHESLWEAMGMTFVFIGFYALSITA